MQSLPIEESPRDNVPDSLNILHILVALASGGKERLILDVCREGPALGLNGSVLAMSGGGLRNQFEKDGVNLEVHERRLPIDQYFVRAIRRTISEHDIDVVHSHEPVEGIHAFLATRRTSIPHILSLHGYFDDWKNRTALWFLRSRVDTLVSVSESYRSLEPLMRIRPGGAPQVVLHNGIDPKRFTNVRPLLRRELWIDDRSLLAGTIAHFVPGKDPQTIARALSSVMDAVPNLHFVFVGGREVRTPSLYESCLRYCQQLPSWPRIHFVGPREDIPEILASLDLLVQSSQKETFGLVAIEAMYVGTPLLLSRIPAFIEVTSAGKHAFFFDVGGAEDLAGQMTSLLTNEPERMRKVMLARAWVEKNFTIEKHISGLRDIYLHAIAKRSRDSDVMRPSANS